MTDRASRRRREVQLPEDYDAQMAEWQAAFDSQYFSNSATPHDPFAYSQFLFESGNVSFTFSDTNGANAGDFQRNSAAVPGSDEDENEEPSVNTDSAPSSLQDGPGEPDKHGDGQNRIVTSTSGPRPQVSADDVTTERGRKRPKENLLLKDMTRDDKGFFFGSGEDIADLFFDNPLWIPEEEHLPTEEERGPYVSRLRDAIMDTSSMANPEAKLGSRWGHGAEYYQASAVEFAAHFLVERIILLHTYGWTRPNLDRNQLDVEKLYETDLNFTERINSLQDLLKKNKDACKLVMDVDELKIDLMIGGPGKYDQRASTNKQLNKKRQDLLTRGRKHHEEMKSQKGQSREVSQTGTGSTRRHISKRKAEHTSEEDDQQWLKSLGQVSSTNRYKKIRGSTRGINGSSQNVDGTLDDPKSFDFAGLGHGRALRSRPTSSTNDIADSLPTTQPITQPTSHLTAVRTKTSTARMSKLRELGKK